MTSTIVADCSKPLPQTADFSQICLYLEVGVHRLMDSPEHISATEYVNLSFTAYNLARRSRTCALDLQKNLNEIFTKRVQLTANQAVKMVDLDLLRYYLKEFHEYKTGVERVNRVFAFYNRRWAKKVELGDESPDVILPVNSLGLTRWKENCASIIQGDGRKLTSAILQIIAKDRNGEEIDEGLVKNAIASFIALDIDHSPCRFYQEEFAVPFLQATADYHKKGLQQVFQSENFIPDYLNKFEEIILEEEGRAKRYLPQQTHDEVIRKLLISDHCEALAMGLFHTSDDKKLRGMYTVLSRIMPDGLEPLKKSFKLYVKATSHAGGITVNVQGVTGQLSLSAFHQRQQELINASFQGDKDFAAILRNYLRAKNKATKT